MTATGDRIRILFDDLSQGHGIRTPLLLLRGKPHSWREGVSQERSGACRARGTRIVPLFGGRKVDLRTAEDLSLYFREDVLKRRSSNMRKEDEVCLRHMRDAAREVLGFVQGRTRADLNSDRIAELLLMCDATVDSAR